MNYEKLIIVFFNFNPRITIFLTEHKNLKIRSIIRETTKKYGPHIIENICNQYSKQPQWIKKTKKRSLSKPKYNIKYPQDQYSKQPRGIKKTIKKYDH